MAAPRRARIKRQYVPIDELRRGDRVIFEDRSVHVVASVHAAVQPGYYVVIYEDGRRGGGYGENVFPIEARAPRENPTSVGGFVSEHPWMTFFVVLSALGTVQAIATSEKPGGWFG